MLLYIDSDEIAQELYKEMNGFLEEIRRGKREIWPPAIEIKSPDSDEPSSSSSTSTNRLVNSLSATLMGTLFFLFTLIYE